MRFAPYRRLFALATLAVLAALVFGGAAFAAKENDAKATKPALLVKDGDKYRVATAEEIKAAGGDSHEKPGPLDFAGLKRYDLGLYTLVVFALLLFIITKFAWPSIKEGLEKRETNIRSALDEAKKDRAEAQLQLADAKKQIDDAAAKTRATLDEARRDADVLRATEREAGAKDAAAERERAKREIETAKDTALKDIYEKTVELAALMSEKALRRTVSVEDHRRLLDESLAELNSVAKV